MLPLRELSQRVPLRELSLLASLVGASAVLVWRVQEGRTAVTAKKILIPPLGMATGFCMFLVRDFRFPLLWAACAFLLGAVVFAYPLLRTSRLVRDGDVIMMQRSNIFFVVVIVLAAIRILAHSYIDRFVDVKQTAALFFVLAFGMILRWRVRMFFEYRRLTGESSG
jgi:membrane protein CcdC involved in cytochrome C biogenesis